MLGKLTGRAWLMGKLVVAIFDIMNKYKMGDIIRFEGAIFPLKSPLREYRKRDFIIDSATPKGGRICISTLDYHMNLNYCGVEIWEKWNRHCPVDINREPPKKKINTPRQGR